MCRGVAVGRDPVGTGGDDPAVPGDDCAEGASRDRYVLFGKPDGYPHQLLTGQGAARSVSCAADPLCGCCAYEENAAR